MVCTKKAGFIDDVSRLGKYMLSIYTMVFTRKSLLPNPEAIPLTISARKRSIVNAYLILGVYEDHQDLFVCLMLKAKEA